MNEEILQTKEGKNLSPTISLFYGIKITINPNDHNPPHFHAEYNGQKISVNIITGEILNGYMERKQIRLILAWAELSKDELMEDWELMREGKLPNPINPLRK